MVNSRSLAAPDRGTAFLGDDLITKLTIAGPSGTNLSQIDAARMVDLAVAPDNARLFAMAADGRLFGFAITNAPGSDRVSLAAIPKTPVTLPIRVSRDSKLVISRDGRSAYVGGKGAVVSVNLIETVGKEGAIQRPFEAIQTMPFKGAADQPWDLTDRNVVGMGTTPDGEALIVLVEGQASAVGSTVPGVDEEIPYLFGAIFEVAIGGLLDGGMPAAPSITQIHGLNVALHDLKGMTLSPDGNYALVFAAGSDNSRPTPFGVMPGNDDADGGGILVFDLLRFQEIPWLIPTLVKGEPGEALRMRLENNSLDDEQAFEAPSEQEYKKLYELQEAIGDIQKALRFLQDPKGTVSAEAQDKLRGVLAGQLGDAADLVSSRLIPRFSGPSLLPPVLSSILGNINALLDLAQKPAELGLEFRSQLAALGITLSAHPKVQVQAVETIQFRLMADEGRNLALQGDVIGTILGLGMVFQGEVMDKVFAQYKEIYKDFPELKKYSETFPSDMVSAAGGAISSRGDLGIVTFARTGNLGFLHLEPARNLGGYGFSYLPNFYFEGATEKVVNGLNLNLGIEDATAQALAFQSPYSWLFMKKVAIVPGDDQAVIGMTGGIPSLDYKSRFGVMNLRDIRERLSNGKGEMLRQAISPGLIKLVGGQSNAPNVDLASPNHVAALHPFDSDGDGVSDHVEAFNRFNSLKDIPFGDPSQLISTSERAISDPSTTQLLDIFPRNYSDIGYFLPHSGLGYRFDTMGAPPFAVNVGSAVTVSTLERIGRRWHELYLTNGVSRPYYVITDMSSPGEGLVQDKKGAYRHFNPRNGWQANIPYFHGRLDKTFDFVLSNSSERNPLDNSVPGALVDFAASEFEILIDLFLNEPTVAKVAMDPGVAKAIPKFANHPKIEFHGSLDAKNSRRDLDAYMKVLFQPAEGVSVSAGGSFVSSSPNTNVRTNWVVLPANEGAGTNAFRISIPNENAAWVQVSTDGNGPASLYFDSARQRPVTTNAYAIGEFSGVLWWGDVQPGIRHVLTSVYDRDRNLLSQTPSAIAFIRVTLDVGGGELAVTEGDSDKDAVPDYADGFNHDGISGPGDADRDHIPDSADDQVSNLHFLPIRVRVEGPIDRAANPILRIDYDASDPSRVARWTDQLHPELEFVSDFDFFTHFQLPTTGSLRLWRTDGSTPRSLKPVFAQGSIRPADYVAPGLYEMSSLPFDVSGTAYLYMEAITHVSQGVLNVSLDPDGLSGPASFVLQDQHEVFTRGSNRFDLGIDSNNDGLIDDKDDSIEDQAGDPRRPGHILLVHQNATGVKGVPDFAALSPLRHQFLPITFNLPPNLGTNTRISIDYSASDPRLLRPTESSASQPLPPGHLRLWKTDSFAFRAPTNDFVAPGMYFVGELPRTLFVEAVRASSDIADLRIMFQLHSGGITNRNFVLTRLDANHSAVDERIYPGTKEIDAVRLTVYDQRWERSFAPDATYRRCDFNGQPMPDPQPQDEPEHDPKKDELYIDAFSLTPVYSTADVAVPCLGDNLELEFRRTGSIDAFLSIDSSPLVPVDPIGPDNIIGSGWRTSIGMRVILHQGIYTVYDENGQARRYNTVGQPIPHSFQEASTHRSSLKIEGSHVFWTRNFWTEYSFEAYDPDPTEFGNRPVVGQVFRLVQVSDNNSNAIRSVYSNPHASYPDRIEEVAYPRKAIKFSYKNLGGFGLRLEFLTDPNGNQFRFAYYDSSGLLQSVISPDPNGAIGGAPSGNTAEQYKYPVNRVDYTDGTHVNFVALSEIRNPNANITRFDYELVDRGQALSADSVKALRLRQVVTAAGSPVQATATFRHAAATPERTVTRVVDFRGTVHEYSFETAVAPSSNQDGLGYPFNGFTIPVLDRMTLVVEGTNKWTYEFSNDTFCNLEKLTDSYGNITRFAYGNVNGFDHRRYNRPSARTIDPRDEGHDGLNLTSRFEYDFVTRKLSKEVRPRFFTEQDAVDGDHTSQHTFDSRQNRIQVNTPFSDVDGARQQESESYTYDANGFLSAHLDPDGRLTRIQRLINPKGWQDQVTIFREHARGPLSNIVFIAFTNFVSRTTHHDLNGNVIKEEVTYEDPDSGRDQTDTTDFTYDAANNQIKEERPGVQSADGPALTKTRPTIQRTFDGLGKLIEEIDARGTVTMHTYDARENKASKTTLIENQIPITERWVYDAAGLVVSNTDPNANVTVQVYDALNRLIERTEINRYFDPGLKQPVEDQRRLRYVYGRNAGSFVFTTDHWKPTVEVDARNFPKELVYDANYRLVEEREYWEAAPATSISLAPNHELDKRRMFVLDANGNIIQETHFNPLGSGPQVSRRRYDSLDRPIEEVLVIGNGQDITNRVVYDRSGHVVRTVDGEGHIVLNQYNTLRLPVLTVVSMDGSARLQESSSNVFAIALSTVKREDIVHRFKYDGRGNKIEESYPREESGAPASAPLHEIVTQSRYDPLNRLIRRIENSDGSPSDLPDEKITEHTYDHNGNLRLERVRREDYQQPGAFVWIETEHQYDRLNRHVRTLLPPVPDGENQGELVRGRIELTYDANGNILTERNPRGTVTQKAYDGFDRLIHSIQNADGDPEKLDANDIVHTWVYDPNDKVVEERLRRHWDSKPNSELIEVLTRRHYDSFDRLRLTTDAETNHYAFVYDNVDNVVTNTEPRGFSTVFRYDAANRKVQQIDPPVDAFAPGETSSAERNHRPTTVLDYDRRGLVTRVTDPNGNVTRYRYDAARRMIEEINAKGDRSLHAYDQADNLTLLTNFRGFTTTNAYDNHNRLVAVSDPEGATTRSAYDLADGVKRRTDAKGNSELFEYDLRGRLVRFTERGNTQSKHYTHTLTDGISSIVDENGLTNRVFYDAFDRVIQQQDHDGFATHYRYDEANNRIEQIDALTNKVTSRYDLINRLVAVDEELGKHTEYRYDPSGNRTHLIDPNANVTHFAFDGLNRLTNVIFPTLHGYRYGYDRKRNLVEIINPNTDRIVRTYDSLDRMTSLKHPGHSFSFKYDSNSNPTETIHQESLLNIPVETYTTKRDWDKRDQLRQMECAYPNAPPRSASYGYDPNRVRTNVVGFNGGRIECKTDAKDLFTSIQGFFVKGQLGTANTYDQAKRLTSHAYNNSVSCVYTYENRNLVQEISIRDPGNREIHASEYAYNGVRFRLFEKEIAPRRDGTQRAVADVYRYDPLYRVTGAKYRVNTQRTPDIGPFVRPISPGNYDSLPAVAGLEDSYAYDLEENRIRSTDQFGSRTYNSAEGKYEPDPWNRILTIDDADPAPAKELRYDDNGNLLDGGKGLTFVWNALNQLERVLKGGTNEVVRYSYDERGLRCAKVYPDGTRTYYYYDGKEVSLETDGLRSTQTEYLLSDEIDEPIGLVRDGITAYFHQNTLNNVELLTGASGEVLNRFDYAIYGEPRVLDAFGEPTAASSAPSNAHLFTGQPFDSETGLYYYRSRYYSPELGRFLSTDPLDYVDGENLFAYVNDNVVNLSDPFGTQSKFPQFQNLSDLNFPIPTDVGMISRRGFSVDHGKNIIPILGAVGVYTEKSVTMGKPTDVIHLKSETNSKKVRGAIQHDAMENQGLQPSLLRKIVKRKDGTTQVQSATDVHEVPVNRVAASKKVREIGKVIRVERVWPEAHRGKGRKLAMHPGDEGGTAQVTDRNRRRAEAALKSNKRAPKQGGAKTSVKPEIVKSSKKQSSKAPSKVAKTPRKQRGGRRK